MSLPGGHLFLADYGREELEPRKEEWACLQCGTANFAQRTTCRKCGAEQARTKEEQGDRDKEQTQENSLPGQDDICPTPTPFVLLRGIPPESTPQNVPLLQKRPLKVHLVNNVCVAVG